MKFKLNLKDPSSYINVSRTLVWRENLLESADENHHRQI